MRALSSMTRYSASSTHTAILWLRFRFWLPLRLDAREGTATGGATAEGAETGTVSAAACVGMGMRKRGPRPPCQVEPRRQARGPASGRGSAWNTRTTWLSSLSAM